MLFRSFMPLHPYGVSKVGQDLLAYQYFVNDNIRSIRARIFNCTGPRKRNDVVSDFGKAAAIAAAYFVAATAWSWWRFRGRIREEAARAAASEEEGSA